MKNYTEERPIKKKKKKGRKKNKLTTSFTLAPQLNRGEKKKKKAKQTQKQKNTKETLANFNRKVLQ